MRLGRGQRENERKGAPPAPIMFSIGFTDEPLEYPYDDDHIPAAPGLLMLGKTSEGFLANLGKWDKKAYESQWTRELNSLVEGSSKVSLVASFAEPQDAAYIEVWPCYRDEEWVWVQNRLLSYSSLPPEFNVLEVSRYLRDRRMVDEDGNRISEWRVALRDIETFLHRSGVM